MRAFIRWKNRTKHETTENDNFVFHSQSVFAFFITPILCKLFFVSSRMTLLRCYVYVCAVCAMHTTACAHTLIQDSL